MVKWSKLGGYMKKGFTLIELLAVILILGIIALIAVPQVTNTIEKSKKGAAETSAKHYIDAVTNAIGLNQLDEDDSNDINDGTHSVSDLIVDISGEPPQSGTVVIEEGSVKNANFVINGYNVVCTGKGKCTATKQGKGDYVYYQTEYTPSGPDDFPTITYADTTLTPDLSKKAYLKYPVSGSTLGTPQACFNDGTEFCLNPEEYETSKQKILNYFGYDSTTWTQDSEDETVWTNGDKYCDIDYSTKYMGTDGQLVDTIAVSCDDSSVGAYADAGGDVYADDMSAGFYCDVFGVGRAVCYVY